METKEHRFFFFFRGRWLRPTKPPRPESSSEAPEKNTWMFEANDGHLERELTPQLGDLLIIGY